MINKNDLRRAISSISISNAKRNTIYKAFSDLDSITKEEFDSVKSDISKVVESMLTKDTVGKANGVASLDSNGNVPIEQLGNIDTTLFLIVRELPITNIKTNKIYLVPNQDGQGNNVYIEYLYVENVWEKLGEFKPEVDITGKADKNETIVEIKRLTGKAGREWNADTDIEMCDDFYQYLLKRGNYCGIYIRCLKSKIINNVAGNYIFKFGDYHSLYLKYDNSLNDISAMIETGDETSYICSTESSNLKEDFIVAIVPAKLFYSGIEDDYLCIVLYNIFSDYAKNTFYNEYYDKNSDFNSYIVRGFDKVYELPECVQSFGFISYTNSNNYRVKYADGRYALINTDKNVVIGGKDYNANDGYHAEGFGENGTTFTRGGTLDVNGSATVRDLTTRSITANGSVTINKELNVEESIRTKKTLEAGETTIKGTLHCETHDIKTKSIYPAGTGSSSLKNPSLGAVKGNYIVNKGNLGKPAHNYDKLFVENIFWSDRTDFLNPETSLNNDYWYSVYRIFSKKGYKGKPTFYTNYTMYNELDDGCQIGIFSDMEEGIGSDPNITMFYNDSENPEGMFSFHLDYGYIKHTIYGRSEDCVFGNGVRYNANTKIPADFVNLSTYIKSDDVYQCIKKEYDSSKRGAKSIAIDDSATASGEISIALGSNASAKNTGSIALGRNTIAVNNYAIALGCGARTGGEYSIALGYDAKTTRNYAVAIGKNYFSNKSIFSVGFNGVNGIDMDADNYGLYLKGFGGYTGQNLTKANNLNPDIKSVQQIINEKADLVDGKLKAEQLPKLVNITNASTAEEVVTKFNALLSDLKAKGYMEADTVQ